MKIEILELCVTKTSSISLNNVICIAGLAVSLAYPYSTVDIVRPAISGLALQPIGMHLINNPKNE